MGNNSYFILAWTSQVSVMTDAYPEQAKFSVMTDAYPAQAKFSVMTDEMTDGNRFHL